MTTGTIRPVAAWLLGLSAVLILGGVSLLIGAQPIALPFQSVEVEMSTAYSSELVIAVDDESSASDLLTAIGGVLLVGGLMVSAAATGFRLGRKAAGHE